MNVCLALLHCGFTALLMLLSGYAVCGASGAGRMTRLLLAPVSGLALQLWSVSVINLAWPLTQTASLLVLWPVVLVFVVPKLRRTLIDDLAAAASNARARAAAAGMVAIALALVVPLMAYPDLVFFDGTSNHDNFFWVVGAEYLQSSLYSIHHHSPELPRWLGVVPVILGLEPAWGRIGAEAWGAAMSGVVGTLPIRWYTGGVAALVLTWVTTTLALARATGWLPRTVLGTMAGCALQPLLVFFIFNGNLPNLLGTLCGGGLLVAARFAVGADESLRRLGIILIPLLLHATLVSYPEVAPFVGLPAALVVVGAWIRPRIPYPRSRMIGHITAAVLGGLLINPISTWRAFHGFLASFAFARADGGWPNIFSVLSPLSYFPASLTLATNLLDDWSPIWGAVWTLLLLASVALAWRCARDRWLAVASISGFLALVIYTLATDFSYGWQKASQFSGLALAALFPFGVMSGWMNAPIRLRLVKLAGAAACCFLAFRAAHSHVQFAIRVAAEKGITATMLDVRESALGRTPDPVLVIGDTFRAPYFQSMWAMYLFSNGEILCPEGAAHDGGYLTDHVGRYDPTHPPPNAGHYIGREWADAFCTDLERTAQDRVYALLPTINHVRLLQGFDPRHDLGGLKGVPKLAGRALKLAVRPVHDGVLELTLRPFDRDQRWSGTLMTRAAAETRSSAILADPDGRLVIRAELMAGIETLVEVDLSTDTPAGRLHGEYPFAVEQIRLWSSAGFSSDHGDTHRAP